MDKVRAQGGDCRIAAGTMTDQLTILLTLKDRISYTVRWMEYANYIRLPFRVLIADGSSDDSAASLLSDRSRFPNLTYDYIRYPYDERYAIYYSKILDALNRVQTPFVVLADNDDFFIVNCVQECVAFLSSHPGYIGCGGLGGICWLSPLSSVRSSVPLYANNVVWKCTDGIRSIDEKSAKERLRADHLEGSDICYYDVKRTDELQRQFRIVRDLDLHDLFLVEWLVFFLTSIAGKTKRLHRLYLVRQHDSPGGSASSHTEQFGDWFGRMLVDSWSEDFNKFVLSVSALLAEADGITEAEARDHVIRLYRVGVAPSLLSNLLDEPTIGIIAPSFFAAVRRLVRLPEGTLLKRIARKVYRKVNGISLDTDMLHVFRPSVPGAGKDMKTVLAFLAQRNP